MLCLALAGCGGWATATYRPYEAREPRIIEGSGGAREIVDGVDVWTNGDPPRRYQVIGTVELHSYDGYGSPLPSLARKVRDAGGQAAVRVERASGSESIMLRGVGASYPTTRATYLVVRYLD
mgnify:CR=1 FL=1